MEDFEDILNLNIIFFDLESPEFLSQSLEFLNFNLKNVYLKYMANELPVMILEKNEFSLKVLY